MIHCRGSVLRAPTLHIAGEYQVAGVLLWGFNVIINRVSGCGAAW